MLKLSKRYSSVYFPILITIVFGLTLSWFIFDSASNYQSRTLQARFNSQAQDQVLFIRNEIDANIAVVSAVKAFYSSTESISRQQFKTFAISFLNKYKSIQALEWVPRVPNNEKDLYEEKARIDIPDFDITEREKQGIMIKAKNRHEYFPVYYVEPLEGNKDALGFDLASNTARLESIQKSRSTGQSVATPAITLVQEKASQFGFLIFSPVFYNSVNTSAPYKDEKTLKGFAVGVYRAGSMIVNALKGRNNQDVSLTVSDVSGAKENILLAKFQTDDVVNLSSLYFNQSFSVADRTWEIKALPTRHFYEANFSYLPSISLLISLLITLFLCLYLWLQLGRSEKIKALVEERTIQLKSVNDELKELNVELDHNVIRRTMKLHKINNELQREIKQHRLTEDALKENQIHLVQSEKLASLGQLAAGVAHEINNPIGYIMGNLGVLKDYADVYKNLIGFSLAFMRGSGNDYSSEQITAINSFKELAEDEDIDYINNDIEELLLASISGTEQVRDIVLGLKSFARLDEAETQEFDLNDCIEQTLNIIWNELKYKCQIDKQMDDTKLMQGYPGQINQVIMNLLMNAAQAIEKEGTIIIKTYYDAGINHLIISDTGKGIEPEHISQLFDPFYTTKPVGEGTGLGLSISYGIIRKHSGTIEVDSEIDKGTKFTVKFPASE